MTKGHEPAMPNALGGKNMNGEDDYVTNGLTKREYFAGLCLQGILANQALYQIAAGKLDPDDMPEFYALCSVEHADALIDELNKKLKL